MGLEHVWALCNFRRIAPKRRNHPQLNAWFCDDQPFHSWFRWVRQETIDANQLSNLAYHFLRIDRHKILHTSCWNSGWFWFKLHNMDDASQYVCSIQESTSHMPFNPHCDSHGRCHGRRSTLPSFSNDVGPAYVLASSHTIHIQVGHKRIAAVNVIRPRQQRVRRNAIFHPLHESQNIVLKSRT